MTFFSDDFGNQPMDLDDDDEGDTSGSGGAPAFGGFGGFGGSSQPSESSTQNSADSPEELRQFFTSSPRFRFIKMLPPGSSAIPMLFSEHEVDNHGNGNSNGKKDGNGKGKEKEAVGNGNDKKDGADDKEDKSDDAGRMKRRIVVKSARESIYDPDLASEQRWLDRLAGSPHIVASLNLGLDYSILKRRMVIMEYVAHGDISELVARLGDPAASDVVVPNRLLWRFFLCREY